MKNRVILVISMLVLSLAVSMFSLFFVRGAMDHLDGERVRALMQAENGNVSECEVLLTAMLTYVSDQRPLLEILTPHDDLHEMINQLTEAREGLASGDMNGFRAALSLFQQNVDHIRTHEALALSNIL